MILTHVIALRLGYLIAKIESNESMSAVFPVMEFWLWLAVAGLAFFVEL